MIGKLLFHVHILEKSHNQKSFSDCKNQIAIIKKMIKIFESIEIIISEILNHIPQPPINVQEFLTKLESYVSNQIEVWSSILKTLEKYCKAKGVVQPIKHQPGKK